MAYEIQFARITNSGKLVDRFLTCQHLKSDDLAKSAMGNIFSLIEIISPWFPTAQIGKLIINNSAKYYYQGGSTSDLANFENSLKRVNEDLAQVTQNGETDWIGNLNGILTVIVGNNLHLAPTGKIDAYIFREGKIDHLTQGLASSEPHPLKTFSNVISGELKNHDKILLTNKGLFNHLSLESLRQIITLNNPSTAALQIIKLLRRGKVKNVNLVIINLVAKDELSKESLGENLENVYYLDKSRESIVRNLGQFGGRFLLPVGKIISKNLGKFFNQLFGLIKEKIFRQKIKIKPQEAEVAHEKPRDRFDREFILPDSRDDLLKDEEIKYSPDLYIHYYNEKKARKRRPGAKVILFLKSCGSRLLELARDKSRRKYLYIGLAVFLILIIALIITFKNKGNQVGNLEAQKILDEAIALQKEGNNLILAGDQEKGKEKLISSIEKAQSIQESPFVANDAQGVIDNSRQELDKATSTTRFSELSPIANTSGSPQGLFVISGQAYIITDNEIFEANVLGGTPSKVASIPKGNFVTGTRQEKFLYLYTSDQNLYEFNSSSKDIELAKIASDARWETANSIASFVGTLYLLDGVVGQIYKHTSSQEEFQKGEEYIVTALIDLKNAISLAIDGAIYVLKNNGQAVKIQRSKLQDFSLKNIPTPYDKITDPRKIYTDADTPSLYVLDGGQKRILEFDKDGRFIHQYALPDDLAKITDFVISSKTRKIWILANNNLYEISI